MVLEKELEKMENDACATLHMIPRILAVSTVNAYIIIEWKQIFNIFLPDISWRVSTAHNWLALPQYPLRYLSQDRYAPF